jgi:lipopolysaccharide export system permease protein
VLSIIDSYIAKQFLAFFFAALLVFITIFLAVDFTSTMVRFDVGLDVLGRYYLWHLPSIAYQMIPVACLTGSLLTLSSLNKSNEMVALFSLGISLLRMSLPILVLVGFIAGFGFWVGDKVIPIAKQKRNYIYFVELKKRPGLLYTVKQDRIWYRSKNIIFNIGVFNPDKNKAQGLTMYYFSDNWDLIQVLKAKDVNLAKDTWELLGGTVTLFTEGSSFPISKAFDSKIISMSEDLGDIRTSAPTSDSMSLQDTARYIQKNKQLGLDTTSFEVDYHSKLAFAFSSLVFAILAIPFTAKRSRAGGAMLDVALCAGLALSYWILFSIGLSMGRAGHIYPMVAAWFPNVLVLMIAGFYIVRLKK